MKSDIFFFITSVSVIVITGLLIVVLGYALYIFASVKRILKIVKKQTELLEKDFEDTRSYLRQYGLSWRTLLKVKDFFSGASKRKSK